MSNITRPHPATPPHKHTDSDPPTTSTTAAPEPTTTTSTTTSSTTPETTTTSCRHCDLYPAATTLTETEATVALTPAPQTTHNTTPIPTELGTPVSYTTAPTLPHTGNETAVTAGIGGLLVAVGLITTALAARIKRTNR